MSDQHSQTDDDFHAEISDVRQPAETRPTAAEPAHSPFDPHLTLRQRCVRSAIVLAVGVLALVIILSANPALRGHAISLVPGLDATATPTLTPGGDAFYLLPNPPGVDVSLDGHTLTRLPAPGDPRPLRLAAGHHTLTWQSRVLPFKPLQCDISVPHALSDTCPLLAGSALPQALGSLPGFTIGMHVSATALAPARAAQLNAAIQEALDSARSTAIVQPGERYLAAPPGQNSAVVVAQESLRATLSYQHVSDAGYSEPCILEQPVVPCRFPGQDCGQMCSVGYPSLAGADVTTAWTSAVLVRAQWTYTTLDGRGRVVATSAEAVGMQLAVLRITWDGAAWHVVPVVGHTPGLDAADDLVCDTARYGLARTTWAFMLVDPPPGEQVLVASSASPAAGCVVVLQHGAPATFLERFGVLLTVNDYARNPIDNLPVADAAEQRLAQQLLQGSGS